MELFDKQESNEYGNFLGFVLLDKPEWNKEKFIADFKNDWGIDIAEDNEENSEPESHDNTIVADIGEMLLAVSFMPAPIPNSEAEHYAAANYLWKNAVEVTKTHTAHILVTVLGTKEDVIEKSKLYVKAAASCLKQETAIGVYSNGAVYEPEYFINFSGMIKDGDTPIFNLIWFGFYKDEEKFGFYTYGLNKFGKHEIEIYVDNNTADLNQIHNFISVVSAYILDCDATLNDGETIGFTPEQQLPITYSDGIALDGKTLKIKYIQELI